LPPFLYPYKWYAIPRLEPVIEEVLIQGKSYVRAAPVNRDVKTVYQYVQTAKHMLAAKHPAIQHAIIDNISGYDSVKDPRLRMDESTARSSMLRLELLVSFLRNRHSELSEISPLVLLNHLSARGA